MDVGVQNIAATGLETPLITELPPNDPTLEKKVVQEIVDLIRSRKNPIVIVDGGKSPRLEDGCATLEEYRCGKK